MRYKKDIPRKFRNGFREENVYKQALPTKEAKKELTKLREEYKKSTDF